MSVEWLIGEALTNLYVGLCRFHRGEKLSAMRFIQHYAVDRIVELSFIQKKVEPDYFAKERRFETHFPELAGILPEFMQGYLRSRESARAILEFLQTRFEINPFVRERILYLIES
jgi:hypothetical protein